MSTLGKTAYEAYFQYADGKSLATGAILPGWDALKSDIREAWEVAAFAVLTAAPHHHHWPEGSKVVVFGERAVAEPARCGKCNETWTPNADCDASLT
jgi:hypothetical protein